jgi:hypothetical protein
MSDETPSAAEVVLNYSASDDNMIYNEVWERYY